MVQINVIDIKSTQKGYMGNLCKLPDLTYIWNPAKGKRLANEWQTYMGNPQSYVNRDGTLSDCIEEPIIPVNAYRP